MILLTLLLCDLLQLFSVIWELFQGWEEEEDDETEQRSVKPGGVHQLCCLTGVSE